MGFFEDVKLTLLLTRKFGDQLLTRSVPLPSVKQTAETLVSEITTTLGTAEDSTDISFRKLYLASTKADIRELKRLAPRCRELKDADLHQLELQASEIEKQTKILEQRAIAQRSKRGKDFEKQGLIDQAITVYEKLVTRMVESPFPYRRLAILYRRLKSHDDEIRVLVAALSNVPKSNRKHFDWFEARLFKIQKTVPVPAELQAG
jgi:hypothetical protein